MGAVVGLESYIVGYFPQIPFVWRYNWVIPITTSIIRQQSWRLKEKQQSLRRFPTKSLPPGLRGLQTPYKHSCLPGAAYSRLPLSMTAFMAADMALISRFFPIPPSGQSLMKSMGSLEAGAKWVRIRNGQVLKVLLDVGAGYRGWRGRLPQVALSVVEWGWHRHCFWKRGFPAWFHVPSPSAPEAFFWAPWQEDSECKRENKKVHFLSSPNTFSSGIWMKNTYLVTFQAYCRRRTEKKPPNY